MKKIFLTSALALGFCLSATFCMAENRYTGEYAGQHLSHYAIGGVVGGLTSYYYPEGWNQDYKVVTSLLVPLVTGLLLETAFDGANGTWDFLDVLEYTAGGAGAVFIMQWRF